MRSSTLNWASLLLSQLASAVPTAQVTPVLLGSSCNNFPSTTSAATIYVLYADQVSNPSVNGLWGFDTAKPDPVLNKTRIFVTTNRGAHYQLECVNGVARNTGNGLPAMIAGEATDRGLYYDATSGHNLEAYAHEVNGVRQNGTFIGNKGVTTWGFTFQAGLGGVIEYIGSIDGYVVRLLGPGSGPLKAGEYTGFLKAEGNYFVDAP
jgi:hypothetical protein